MKARARRKRPAAAMGMNTTTMVDVLFILLIFFIVVSEVRTGAVPVDLPDVAKKEEEKPPGSVGATPLVITIDARNALFLDDAPVASLDSLRPLLQERKARAGDANPTVVLRTDQDAKGSKLVEVVGLLSEVGFRSLQFDVSEKDPR